ncbi:dynein axonemal assembly factor 3 [Heteronotia binoei]|uniref:dynein axonemal assembly factor 3 n=1 Tax=Heteronotia binoei TaxID=13085 RepID=UPI00292F951F|nr:dynein axonemal assembly factor 3 [Heteronotia binoei]
MTAAGCGSGFGTTAWWGFSPALDLQATYLDTSTEHLRMSQDGIPELNILLVGSIDGRHILRTMCQAHRWPQRKISFYVLENNLEVLGRQLLFLSLALEPLEKMGLQEKSETFLELMGNTLIRSQTAAYLQEKAALFIRYITDPDVQQADLPALDLSALKFKERDQLEAIFRFWKNPDPRAFQVEQLWDLRLRQFLGTRYDARRGVCDWDLTMKLHERGAKVIGSREFFRWRNTGVAFEMREASYDTPNKTLASGRLLRHKGEPMPARGYWGDIATGPFITFGTDTEETSLLKTINGLPSKSAQDISLYNVTALFYELSHRSRYDPPTASDKEGEGDSLQGEEDHAVSDAVNSQGSPCTEDIRVHFLPLNCLPQLHQKSQYQKLFNLIFFSCSMVHLLKPELCLVSAPKATLITELATFLPDLSKDQVSEFSSRMANQARGMGFMPVEVPGKAAFSLFHLGDPPEMAGPGL